MRQGEIKFEYPLFVNQVQPKGYLNPDKACHACWYYFMLAHASKVAEAGGIESQVIVVDPGLETPLWMEKRYHQIAKTVALIYGLDSPEDFLPYRGIVEKEARRLADASGQYGFEFPGEIWRPFGVGLIL